MQSEAYNFFALFSYLEAHDQAIRSMVWSHNDNWMVSGDDGGAIKYLSVELELLIVVITNSL